MWKVNQNNTQQNEGWGWSDTKYVAIGVIIITIIISLFEFNPDMYFWMIEILRNLVISASISFTIFVLSIVLRANVIVPKWISFIKTILLFAVGGFLGGLIAWGINDILFGFNVTHPVFYFILTSSLAVIFGFILYGYISVQERLKITAARLAEKEVNEQKLVNLKTKAELEALRAKVDPHFFFNTLNSIASLISEDPAKAEETVEKFAHLFRYTLDASNKDMVKLTDELEFIKEYLDVEKIRLADRLRYRIDTSDDLHDISIPGMLLQPLVENSIKHGISPLKNGGTVNIRCRRKGEQCIISLSDSGNGFDPQLLTGGFGLRGVKERLKLSYGTAAKIEISAEEGSEIRIEIPVKRS
jgi:sensor histidine kinase YesM